MIYNYKSLSKHSYLSYNYFIMKKSLLSSLLLWALILSWCGWSSNVVEYNDTLVSIVKECTDSNHELFETFQANWSTIDSIADALQTNIDMCNEAKEKAIELWDYDKDSSLKDAVVDLLSMEVEYLEKFWSTSHYRNVDDLTDEDKAEYDSVVNDLNESQELLNQQFTNLQEAQEAFAAKHELKLE